jgi:hypothetical protein
MPEGAAEGAGTTLGIVRVNAKSEGLLSGSSAACNDGKTIKPAISGMYHERIIAEKVN